MVRRVVRHIVNAVTLLSLLLFLFQSIALWAINYWEDPRFMPRSGPNPSVFRRMLDTTFGGESSPGVPVWIVIAITAIPPCVWVVHRLIVASKRNAGCASAVCAACSYDLTGNLSGVCPECGKIVEKAI